MPKSTAYFLQQRRNRAKRFRAEGLNTDAPAQLESGGQKAERERLLVAELLQKLAAPGSMQRKGGSWWVVVARSAGEAVCEVLAGMDRRGELEVCRSHGGTGVRCLSHAWSRVRWRGLAVEVWASGEDGRLKVQN